MKPLALCLGSLSALAVSMGMAGAATAQSVEIEGAVARVVVIPEDRADVGVEIVPGRADLPALQVVRRGQKVMISGQLGRSSGLGKNRLHLNRCHRGDDDPRQPGQGAEVEIRRYGKVALEDAPLIVLRTPRAVDVSSSGGTFGSVGPGASALDLEIGGCGSWTVANVSGPAELALGGSIWARLGNTSQLDVSMGGAGKLMARETGAFSASIGGSGDIELARVNGPASIQIGGSGDVRVKGGRMETLDISIAGSGDIRVDGVVGDLQASIAGSGDVQVREVTGRISRSIVGSGRVNIGQ